MIRRLSLAFVVLAVAGCVEAAPPALDYGTVIGVNPAKMASDVNGGGSLLGAAAGGVIGSQFGGGVGAAAVTIAGIIVGENVGTAVDASLQESSGLQYTLKLDNGHVATIVQHRFSGDPILMPGSRAVIETNGREQRVLPAPSPSRG